MVLGESLINNKLDRGPIHQNVVKCPVLLTVTQLSQGFSRGSRRGVARAAARLSLSPSGACRRFGLAWYLEEVRR